MNKKPRVLFLCSEKGPRSQEAGAFRQGRGGIEKYVLDLRKRRETSVYEQRGGNE
ncbi:MAG: hypothetical protein PVH80_11270 [Anaerolineae bacterium]|jgi:hypothetical protein